MNPEIPSPPRSKDSGLPAAGDEAPGPFAGEFGDWTPEEFARNGHLLIDWIASYLATVGDHPVVPHVLPGEIAARMPMDAPETPETFDALLSDLDRVVVPGLTHWNHPGFFAYFGISASGPGILGELAAAAFNTNGMLWKTSPATTEVELRIMGWIRGLLGLPADWFGHLTDTASVAVLLALAAAREAVPGMRVREEGLVAPGHARLRFYASEQAHSSIEKAGIALGLGQAGLRKIPTDRVFRMDPGALSTAIAEDRAAGWQPFAVAASAGTTATTSVDPLEAIADICASEGLWMHVDAAYAGSAQALPEMREYFRGFERADSYVMNPHKWLFVPIDASALYTRHPEVLRRAFRLVPPYLETDVGAEAVDLMDYGVQLGRRFRAIKLWWVLRAFGAEGIRKRIREHCSMARELADRIDADPRFARIAPVPFSTVVFRGVWDGLTPDESDRANERLAARVTAHGPVFLAHTRLNGRIAIRFAIGNLRTDRTRIETAWSLLQQEYANAPFTHEERC